MTIGEKIKYHRTLLGLTQTQLGERLGVKNNAVSKSECGRVDDIHASKVKAIAQLFSVPVSYLIDDAPQDDDGIISAFVAKALNRGDCAQKRVLRSRGRKFESSHSDQREPEYADKSVFSGSLIFALKMKNAVKYRQI